MKRSAEGDTVRVTAVHLCSGIFHQKEITKYWQRLQQKKEILHLVEDLIDEVHIVPGGEQNGLHHVINMAVLLLNATQTGIAGSSI